MCSTHPDGESRLSTGETLGDVLAAHPEYLGSHAATVADGSFPILIKLIDAKEKLSVQVHPDDAYARREGQLGKTEMWYVLDAKSGAELVYGFNQDMDADGVRLAIETGTIENYLNHVPVKKNDLFFIEPGTVHAIGAGVLLAEVQESSNLTFRLYDYERVGKDGKKRPLHVDKALDVLRMESSVAPRQPMRVLKYKPGCASELLTRCRYFQVERLLLNTENRRLADFQTGDNSFHVLLCVDGCGNIGGEGFSLNFFKGDCIFIPANSIPLQLHGKGQLLNVSC